MIGYGNSFSGYSSSGYSGGGYSSSGGWGSLGYSGGGYGSGGYSGGGFGSNAHSLMDMGNVLSNWHGKGLRNSYANTVNNSTNNIDTDRTAATIGGTGGGILGVKAGIAAKMAAGLGAGAAASHIIGVAAVAGVGAMGAVALTRGSPIMMNMAGKAMKTTGNLMAKSARALISTYNTYNKNKPTKSDHLQKVDEKSLKREEKFKNLVSNIRKDLKVGKDVKGDLQQLHHLKIPTQKARKELNNLTADYIIKNNIKDNKIDTKSMNKELKSFAQETKLSKNEFKQLEKDVKTRVEEHKDNFIIDKNLKITNLNKNKERAKNIAKEKIEEDKQKIKDVEKKQSKQSEQNIKIKNKEQSQSKPKEIEQGKELGR